MSEWRQVFLDDVAREVTVGHVGPMKSEYLEQGVPFLRSQDVRPHWIDTQDIAYVSSQFHERLRKSALVPGDVVTVRTGKPGTTAVVPSSLPVANCSDLVITRVGPDVDPNWLSYYINEAAKGHVSAHLVGAVQQHFNVGAAKKMMLVLPPLWEQRAIVEVLGALDDKIAANTRLVSTLLQLADAHFAAAAAHSTLSDQTFADIANVGGGGTPKTKVDEYWGDEINWATPTDVTALHGRYLNSTSRRITQAGLDNCSSALYPTGSILMTSRATIGAFAVAQTPMAVNQGFIVVNSKGDVPQWWLFHEMQRRVPEFVSHANGATFLELSRGKFKNFHVHLAATDVMQGFAETADALHNRAAAAERETASLAATRDALLPLLMSGRVTVRDAETAIEGVA